MQLLDRWWKLYLVQEGRFQRGVNTIYFWKLKRNQSIWRGVNTIYFWKLKRNQSIWVQLWVDQPRQHIQKQRHYFANKGPSSQGYDFSSSHVWMWELDYKESWAPKNWCFCCCFFKFIYFFHLFLLSGGYLLYSIVVVFAIHWHESAMDLHIFPIPIPAPTSLST